MVAVGASFPILVCVDVGHLGQGVAAELTDQGGQPGKDEAGSSFPAVPGAVPRHGSFLGQHVWHKGLQPDAGKEAKWQPVHGKHGEAGIDQHLSKVVGVAHVREELRGDETTWTLQVQLHVLLQVRAVVVEHADDVKPESKCNDPWLVALAETSKVAVLCHQTEHRGVVHG